MPSAPIHWHKDRSRPNLYGRTSTGENICYIYENVDMRLRGKEPSWTAHFYLGGEERPVKGKRRLGYFANRGLAMRAARRHWHKILNAWMTE